jgi:hypothetical protein
MLIRDLLLDVQGKSYPKGVVDRAAKRDFWAAILFS